MRPLALLRLLLLSPCPAPPCAAQLTQSAAHSKPQVGVNGYDGFKPGETTLLKKGSTREGWDGERTRALDSDILLEHDVALTMRDGATLYTDIYRPTDATGPVPVLVMWSPYGKR